MYKAKSRIKTKPSLRVRVVKFCVITTTISLIGLANSLYEVNQSLHFSPSYPVYAVEPDNQTALEGVGESSSSAVMPVTIATPSASLATPSAQLTDKEEVMAYILEVFGKDADRAIWVAKCESGLRKNAYNGSNSNGTADYGVFQINSVHQKRFGQGYMIDWKENVRVAKKIFDEQGSFRAWVCATSIGEKNYLGK